MYLKQCTVNWSRCHSFPKPTSGSSLRVICVNFVTTATYSEFCCDTALCILQVRTMGQNKVTENKVTKDE